MKSNKDKVNKNMHNKIKMNAIMTDDGNDFLFCNTVGSAERRVCAWHHFNRIHDAAMPDVSKEETIVEIKAAETAAASKEETIDEIKAVASSVDKLANQKPSLK